MKWKKAIASVVCVSALSGVACDQEDINDVEEGVNEVENEVDQRDDDGRDD